MKHENKAIKVARIKKNQWDSFLELQYLILKQYCETYNSMTKSRTIRKMKQFLFKRYKIKQPPYFIWAASIGKIYVGHLWGCVVPIQIIAKTNKFIVIDLIVAPKYRRHGVGSMLLKCLNEFCRDMGIEEIKLQVKKSDNEARLFYAQYGFSRNDYILSLKVG